MSKKKFPNKTIVISAGGTGGHIFAAQAIAEKLKKENYKLHLIYDKRSLKYIEGIFCDVEKTIILTVNPKQDLSNKIINLALLLFSLLNIIWKFLFNRPRLIISFGGYPTVPASLYAIIFCIPLVLHEQNAVLGRVNRMCLPFAKKLLLGFPMTQKVKHKYQSKVFVTGVPIRGRITKIISRNRITTRLMNKNLKILVIGGSQGAKLFSAVVPHAIHILDPTLQNKIYITQQVRTEHIDFVRDIYAQTNCKHSIKVFFNNIDDLYEKHDLIISRAGASSIVEALSFQKAAIFVPFAKAMDNHQLYNAKYLSQKSDIILREESEFSIKWLSSCIKGFVQNTKKVSEIQSSYNKQLIKLHNNSIDTFYNQIYPLLRNRPVIN